MRHKPPVRASSPYITVQGFAALQREQKDIWKRRAEVTRALAAAAAEGDRSENAEYIYRKKQLAEIDRRIRYLQRRMPALNVVSKVGDTRRVFFGAWVTLVRVDSTKATSKQGSAKETTGAEVEYRIVGGDELDSDSSKGYISVDSPMAAAMLKKQVDDQVTLELGDESRVFYITNIRYE